MDFQWRKSAFGRHDWTEPALATSPMSFRQDNDTRRFPLQPLARLRRRTIYTQYTARPISCAHSFWHFARGSAASEGVHSPQSARTMCPARTCIPFWAFKGAHHSPTRAVVLGSVRGRSWFNGDRALAGRGLRFGVGEAFISLKVCVISEICGSFPTERIATGVRTGGTRDASAWRIVGPKAGAPRPTVQLSAISGAQRSPMLS
jgi:hypothetical protein